MARAKDCQEASMFHLFVISLTINSLIQLLLQHQNTSPFDKGRHPACVEQEVKQGYLITEAGFYIGPDPKDFRPVRGSGTWM